MLIVSQGYKNDKMQAVSDVGLHSDLDGISRPDQQDQEGGGVEAELGGQTAGGKAKQAKKEKKKKAKK